MHLTVADADSVIKWSVGGASQREIKKKREREEHGDIQVKRYRCLLLGRTAVIYYEEFHPMAFLDALAGLTAERARRCRKVRERVCGNLERCGPIPWGSLP